MSSRWRLKTVFAGGEPKQVRARARQLVEICHGQADLALFTANTVNPDVPLEHTRLHLETPRQ